MTNEEIENAIQGIDSVCEDRQFNIGCFDKCETDGRDCFVKIAKEALEKQISKKMECYEDKYMHCPKCKEAIGYKWKKYPAEKEDFSWLRFCWNCGQKIDGEGEE